MTEPYEIEKDVPMNRKEEMEKRYPLDRMEIGDSFFIPKNDLLSEGGSWNAAAAAVRTVVKNYCRRNPGKAFRTKTIADPDRNVNGLRVWRIEDVKVKPTASKKKAKK